MRASIILPVYNDKKGLARLTTDIERTRLSDYEIIIVDDGSRDEERPAAAGRARLLRFDVNRGPAAARNAGAAAARGNILFFIDADVRLPQHTDVLDAMARALEENPDLDCALSPSGERPAENSGGPIALNYSVYHAYYIKRLLAGKTSVRGRLMFFTTRLGAIRRETFRRSGGFYETLTTVMNEDGEFGARGYHLGHRSILDSSWTHAHAYATSFLHMLQNYWRTAYVQAMIDRKMDTSPDPSIGRAEKLRRIFALTLLPAPFVLLRADARALAAGAVLIALFLFSFGEMRPLIKRVVSIPLRPAFYAVYAGVTPAIFGGYLAGCLKHALGRSLLRAKPSSLDWFAQVSE